MIKVMTAAALAQENAHLKARLAETEAALADAVEAQRRLETIISELRRERFGARSEKLDPEQFNRNRPVWAAFRWVGADV